MNNFNVHKYQLDWFCWPAWSQCTNAYVCCIVLYVQCMLQYVATYFGKLEKQIDEAKSTDTD